MKNFTQKFIGLLALVFAIVSIAASIFVSADEELDVEDTEIIDPGTEALLDA